MTTHRIHVSAAIAAAMAISDPTPYRSPFAEGPRLPRHGVRSHKARKARRAARKQKKLNRTHK